MQTEKPTGLKLLREPFPANQISKLPKPKSRDAVKGHCNVCGGWHGLPAVHLDYVGHAALTDRLLDADPMWNWEPFAVDERGLPALDGFGGMWIRLTVGGVTRIGYGHAGDKQGGDAIKEIIGDALRNSGMRFGAALDLWHKGDLHADEETSLVPVLEASIEQAKQRKAGVMGAVLDDLNLEPVVMGKLQKESEAIMAGFKKHGPEDTFDYIAKMGLENDERTYLWSLLPSYVRTALKAVGELRKPVTNRRDPAPQATV